MIFRAWVVSMVLTFVSPAVVGGAIYKSVDDNGVVSYSDVPSSEASRVEIEPPPASVSSADTAAEINARGRAARAERRAQATDEQERSTPELPDNSSLDTSGEIEVDSDPGRARRNAIREVTSVPTDTADEIETNDDPGRARRNAIRKATSVR